MPPYDRAKRDEVRARWEARKFEPGDLVDGVVLAPGPFEAMRVLLFVESLGLDEGLILRALAPDGTVVDEHAVDLPDVVSWATLPGRWTDPGGPWADDVWLVAQHMLALGARRTHVPVLVTLTGAGDADRVLIGGIPERDWATGSVGPPFHVGVVESLLVSERTRSSYDESTALANHDVLEASLGAASGDVALLVPDTAYEVRVTWSATASNLAGDSAEVDSRIDRLWFRTAADPPDRLDPWILAGVPFEGERHVFGEEPLQLAFATQGVVDLFAAFGETLEVRLLAASGDHPEPVALDATVVQGVAASVLSPWERAVEQLAAGAPCIEVETERVRHSVASLPIPLKPATDHLLDIVTAPGGTRVFRRSFTTSAFGSLAGLCANLRGTRIVHRYAPAGALTAIGAAVPSDAPEGEALDAAFDAAGLGRLAVPLAPRVVLFWEGDAEPQPTGVLLDGTEPLWRERERATLVTLPGTDISHWELERAPWVEPVVTGASTATVTRTIRAPGGQRALLLLAPGARGEKLHVALHRYAFTEPYLDGATAGDDEEALLDVTFLRAPWEEADA